MWKANQLPKIKVSAFREQKNALGKFEQNKRDRSILRKRLRSLLGEESPNYKIADKNTCKMLRGNTINIFT